MIVNAYSSGVAISQAAIRYLDRLESLTFETFYPGGLYGACTFYVPVQPTEYNPFTLGMRISIWDSTIPVYDGDIVNISDSYGMQGYGIQVTCIGKWGSLAMRRHWANVWADNRIDQSIWQNPASAYNVDDISMDEKISIDRNTRIRFTPKNTGFSTSNNHHLSYYPLEGSTVARMTFSYDLQKGAQSWNIGLTSFQSATAFSAEWSATATGAATADVTFSATCEEAWFYMQSEANQTVSTEPAIYGQISSIMVYSVTGDINPTEIVKDIRGHFTEINADETYIGTNALVLEPFICDDAPSMADMLAKVASYGDGTNPWAAYLGHSETAATPDGKPVLNFEQVPALTTFDYVVNLNDPNIANNVTLDYSMEDLANYVIVRYRDENGILQYRTPTDNASQQDTTSIAAYGQKDVVIDIGDGNATVAESQGDLYLVRYKDPKWKMTSPITVIGYILSGYGQKIPAAQIRAGKRLKIANYIDGATGQAVVFLISRTNYDADSDTCTITTGPPPDVYHEPYRHPEKPYDDYMGAGASMSGSGEAGRLNWKRQYGLVEGTPEWEEASRMGKAAWLAAHPKARKARKR